MLLFVLLGTAAGTLTPADARAQDRGVNIDRFRPAFDAEGFLGVQGTRTPGAMRFNTSLWGSWATNPLTITPPTRMVIGDRLSMNLMVQLGFGERWAVGLDMPFVAYQGGNTALLGALDGRGGIASAAVGDPRFAVRFRFLGDGTKSDGSRTEGPGLALQGALTLPVGDQLALAGEGKATTTVNLLGDFHLFGAGAGASLGWRHRFDPQTLVGVRMRDELEAGLALKLPIPIVSGLYGILEGRAITDAARPFADEPTTVVEGDLGARIMLGDFAVTAAVGPGFTGGIGSPGARFVLGLDWTPRPSDADGDGIDDKDDECPHLPEDFDGFQDEDGCLDPDNDNDLVPDEDDRCPNVAADEMHDEDEDGCTDPVHDRDHDGIEDKIDACPSRPEDRDGTEDDDGCPE
ncbi:MAG: hypothetical protein KC417_08245 [Myxococcales bacterium]|nr:hypothetical protein [Myxococcales bacterium]